VFDGPDLDEVASLTGRTADGVVAALAAAELTVAFTGFAPGFGYLTGLPEDLHVPRRATPRTRVPAGAVGLAGPFAGAYPRASPGGWQLVGRTDAVLFDPDRDPPALLVPGATVRLVPC
jgi:KipI family sensor histidine kinase inhibitor